MFFLEDIRKTLSNIKIKEDYILIHSNLLTFGKFNFSVKNLWNTIHKTLGKNKTYLMPAFTFSFTQKKIWDYSKSKSDSGALTEFFRKHIAKKRTIHPIHSLCLYGPNYKKIPDQKSLSSFGSGSTWEWICKSRNVSNLSIGIGLHGGATICHYPEEFHKVKYRSFINLEGKIILKNNLKKKSNFTYFCRVKNKKFVGINNWNNCEKDLIKKKILKKVIIKKKIPILVMNTKKASDFIIQKMKKEKNYLGRLKKI